VHAAAAFDLKTSIWMACQYNALTEWTFENDTNKRPILDFGPPSHIVSSS
jgi:hypothetical protein